MASSSNHRKSNNKLKWFLLLIVVASILVPAGLVGGLEIYFKFQRKAQIDSERQAKAFLEVLQNGMAAPLWTLDTEAGRLLLGGLALNGSVFSIRVLDSDGKEFLSYRAEQKGQLPSTIVVAGEVNYETELIGNVSLEYSLQQALDDAMADSIRLLLVIFVQIIFSIVLIAFALNTRVTRPLNIIKNIASEIARNNFNVSFPKIKDDEFGELAKEVDTTRIALKTHFEKLEELVEQRTDRLQSVNSELQSTIDKLEYAQENLVQNEKLAALGSLVAGISHELNTPLGNAKVSSSALVINAHKIIEDLSQGTLRKSQLEQNLQDALLSAELIEKSLSKAVDLVESFKKTAVDRASQKRSVFEIDGFFHELKTTLQHLFKRTAIQFEFELQENFEIDSFPGLLSQVLTNLINNSLIHAFENRSSGKVIVRALLTDNQVTITVSDDGNGMSDEVQARIFEPFFTTKFGQGGSGLGMHIVHSIVTGPLEGRIEVRSAPGLGTIFELLLPLKVESINPELSY